MLVNTNQIVSPPLRILLCLPTEAEFFLLYIAVTPPHTPMPCAIFLVHYSPSLSSDPVSPEMFLPTACRGQEGKAMRHSHTSCKSLQSYHLGILFLVLSSWSSPHQAKHQERCDLHSLFKYVSMFAHQDINSELFFFSCPYAHCHVSDIQQEM